MKNKTLKLTFTLLIVCAVAALVLAMTNNATKDVIAEKIKETNERNVKDIFGSDVEIVQMSSEELKQYKDNIKGVVEIFTINDKSGNKIGCAVKSETSGYKGGLNILTGIDSEGNIQGVRVISHQETSGIGTNALTDEHLHEFDSQNIESVAVEAVSGATRTSKGIEQGVEIAKEVYSQLN